MVDRRKRQSDHGKSSSRRSIKSSSYSSSRRSTIEVEVAAAHIYQSWPWPTTAGGSAMLERRITLTLSSSGLSTSA